MSVTLSPLPFAPVQVHQDLASGRPYAILPEHSRYPTNPINDPVANGAVFPIEIAVALMDVVSSWNGQVPAHECAFATNPDRATCRTCDAYAALIALYDVPVDAAETVEVLA